jgi:formate dehydrogenase iron-sulfur subunit
VLDTPPRSPQTSRSTSCATPTRATRAPSPTGCSWRATPSLLIEGMTIAAWAVGATEGYVYVRSEYPARHRRAAARRSPRSPGCGMAGPHIHGSGASLRSARAGRRGCLHLRRGDLDAREPRGQARRGAGQAADPGHLGLFGQADGRSTTCSPWRRADPSSPTAGSVCRLGTAAPAAPRCSSWRATSAHGGLVELAFGMTVRELVEEFGGGTAEPVGRSRAVQVGGPLGAYLDPTKLDVPLTTKPGRGRWHARPRRHRGLRRHRRHARMARFAMEFCAKESCGKCTPCRDRLAARRRD